MVIGTVASYLACPMIHIIRSTIRYTYAYFELHVKGHNPFRKYNTQEVQNRRKSNIYRKRNFTKKCKNLKLEMFM